MKGLLKHKGAGNQFLMLVCVALASFFLLGMIGTLVISSISGVSVKEIADLSKLDYSKESSIVFLRGMQVLQFISLFLVPTYICARLFSTDSNKYIGLKKPSNDVYFIAGIVLLLVAIPATHLIGEWNREIQFPSAWEGWMKKSEEQAARVIKAMLSRQNVLDLILNIVFIAGLAAVGEELLFRGMAQRLLIKWFRSPWLGIIVAAILFSALHMQFYGFLPRMILGILLGALYWYSGSIWTAILAHFIYDVFFIVLVYLKPGMLNEEADIPLANETLLACVSVFAVIAILIWMKKRSDTGFNSVYADDSVPVKDHPF